MRRKISYNLQIILLGFALLISIVLVLSLIQTAFAYMKNELFAFYISFFIFVIFIFLFYYFSKIILKFIGGDVGEMDVSDVLYKLPKNYCHLSDVVIGNKGNIDLVVIGPTGIWTIEVKNQIEKVIINDKYLKPHLEQAYAEKMCLQSYLKQIGLNCPVTPILVYANKRTRMNFGMRPLDGVYVIRKDWLVELITKHSSSYLSTEQCSQLKEQLKKLTPIIS
jgi:hypothetical protein